jgi:hypothetical protein
MRSERRHSVLNTARLSLVAAVLTVTVVACASVRSEPFKAFADSNREVRQGADQSIVFVHQWAGERFAAEAASGDEDKIFALLLEQEPGNPYGWKTSGPILPLQVLQFRSAVGRLNDSLVSYSDSLVQLASNETASQEKFDKLATDLNANTRSAVAAMKVKEINDKEVAIFSVGATEAFHQYIEHKRRAKLRDALQKNQDNITQVSTFAREATAILAFALRQEYNLRSADLARGLTPGAKLPAAERQKTVAALLALNEDYVRRLEILATLDRSYATLPAAHAQLSEAIESPNSALGQIQSLYDQGQRLQRLYQELAKPNTN